MIVSMPVAAARAETAYTDPIEHCHLYASRLSELLASMDWTGVGKLALELAECARSRRQVFLCGNGGSAGNCIHLANDLIYGVAKNPGYALRAIALPANAAVLTCLANDEGYDRIFELQLAELANAGDVLVVFSGSGNSPNILKVLERARQMGVKTFGVLGYEGGKAKAMVDVAIHLPVDDMQISEDLQIVVGHMCMQWLWANRAAIAGERQVP